MNDLAARTLETLGALYETAFSVERWPRALDGLAELIGGNGALLFVNDPPHEALQISAMSSRYKPMHGQQYLTSFATADELQWVQVLDEAPPRTIMSDADIWPDRGIYNKMASVQFMKQLNLYHRVAVRPCAHGGWKDALTVLYDDRRDGIRADEERRLSLLLPHLARAIEMQRPFALLQHRFRSVLSVLDHLGIGVLIARAHGEIVVLNQEAERILDSGDGLARTAANKLVAADAAAAAKLAGALQHAERAALLELKARNTVLQLSRKSARDPYIVDVVPFRDGGEEMGSVFNGVLLILIDPEHRDMVSVDGLVYSYGLSQVEGLVCRMLAQGMTLRQIADSRGVSLDTVKTQSRAIYGKTNTKNRRELVRRALSIVPPLLDNAGKRIN